MVILQHPNEILNYKAGLVLPDEWDAMVKAAEEMANFCRTIKHCYSLAAPQCGHSKRFFVMRDTGGTIRYCFNPEITRHGRDLVWLHEKCMSISMGAGNPVPVPRWRIITLKYLDEHMRPKEHTFKSLEARAVQHEIDHLDGLLIIKPFESSDV